MSAEMILKKAEDYSKECRRKNQSPTFRDYESFKMMLHNAGHYGYEKQLSDILKL